MASDPRTSRPTLSTSAASTPSSTRVVLKPVGVPSGQVDGAWWPRSSDLPAELPALLAQLRDRLGNVERVSHNLAGWPQAPGRVFVENRVVRLGGYRTNSVHTIELRTGRGDPTVLLLIPADTSPEHAEAAMSTAAQPGGRDSIEDILGSTSIAGVGSETRK